MQTKKATTETMKELIYQLTDAIGSGYQIICSPGPLKEQLSDLIALAESRLDDHQEWQYTNHEARLKKTCDTAKMLLKTLKEVDNA